MQQTCASVKNLSAAKRGHSANAGTRRQPAASEARKAATRWAGRQQIKSRAHREVLRAIAWLTAGRGAVSHQTLMRRTKCSRRTVVRAIAEFREAGLLTCEMQRGPKGRQGANLYTLNMAPKPVSRRPNEVKFQKAKMATLYTEVVIHQGKNEPCDSSRSVVVDGYGWDGGWPPPDAWRSEPWAHTGVDLYALIAREEVPQ